MFLMVQMFFFYEAIGMGIMRAGHCMFKATFVDEGIPFFEAEFLSIVSEHFLRGSFKIQ